MSFWFYGKAKHGRRNLYSVSVPPQIIVPLLLLLALTIFGMLRGCAH